ncbi:MAG: hypothetical protein P0Y65_20640 [Candidatus Devosia phytovorans]|uniref:Phage tail protein n=1 Tax=Candidatus Devosia phytovorans TaxID=3121372 RepID=A0AAJ6B0B9_9HYPH|nr:hypothetical protein [Devosia sp.]WEK04551.1 MAG: hypothetical protein P0Y65_20640 [Devosia sp.]
MVGLKITWADVSGLRRVQAMIEALGDDRFRTVAARAINRTGDMAKTQVVRAMIRQTGLKRPVLVKAIGKPKGSSSTDLTYVMTTRGGDIALKYFDAREVGRGVSAKPFGKRRRFVGKFMKAGWTPNRVAVRKFAGHVFERASSDRTPIEKVKSGVIIPVEMVQGQSAQAFERAVRTNLPRRVEHEIKRLSKGTLS